jgi:Ti-type conjugative transfer relaxase TraA
MAIYHLSGTIISRSQGRSVVACAAYRAAEKLQDERYERLHDYTKKKDVIHREVLLPEGAPRWMGERERLWNFVEAVEKRKDAQLAREFTIALPRELILEENIALARGFVRDTFVKRGMVADLCIHNDTNKEGERQPHAHVMLTLREVAPDGFGLKVREWNDKALLRDVREAWAETANYHLALHGHDQTIDHRRLSEQAIPLEPQHKIGASVVSSKLARLEDHLRIARENGERLLSDPTIALDAITRQQSTFTHQDLARFVNRHTVDAAQFAVVYEKVKQCGAIVALGMDEAGRERFTTREMLRLENRMMEKAMGLSSARSHDVNPVTRFFTLEAFSDKPLSPEQKEAFHHVLDTEGLKCLVGFAGTGKSTLLGAARLAWEKSGFQVVGVTLSGIAAENLQGGSGIPSRTVASRCHYWDKGEQKLTSRDVLVVDEAGMLSSRHMARLMDEVHQAGAKVVLVGDPQQLQAIEAGAAFRAITERTPTVVLTEIRRQQAPWQQEATRSLAKGDVQKAIDQYSAHDHVHAFETTDEAKAALVKAWNEARLSGPEKTQLMLAYQRRDVLELNQLARSYRSEGGELTNETFFNTERGERLFAEGDRLYFLKNDRALGVMNGSLGTIERIEDKVLTVRVDREGQVSAAREKPERLSFTMERYAHIDYGYAATVHKAQGTTVDKSYVLASTYLDSHASYVSLSRHRESVDLFYGRDAFLSKEALVKTLGRDRAKDVTLDYVDRNAQDFAERRGIPVLNDSSVEKAAHDHLWGLLHEKGQGLQRIQKSYENQGMVNVPLEKAKGAFHEWEIKPLTRLQKESLHSFTHSTEILRLLNTQKENIATASQRGFDEIDKIDQELDALSDQLKEKYDREREGQSSRGLCEVVQPHDEKTQHKAHAFMAEYERLTEIIEKGGRSSGIAKDRLETLACHMARQKDVMAYTREHDPLTAKEITSMANAIALEKTRGRGDREIEF